MRTADPHPRYLFRVFGSLRQFVGLGLAMLALFVSADELPEIDAPSEPGLASPEEAESDLEEIAEWMLNTVSEIQSGMSSNFMASVSRFDRIFGDDRFVEDSNKSRMTLGIGLQYSRFGGYSFEHKTKIRIVLPQTEDRLQLVWDQMTEADDVGTREDLRSAYEETTPELGLRLLVAEPRLLRLTTGTGLRLGSTSQGYGRVRASRTFLLAPATKLYLAQTAHYYTEDRWRVRSEMRFSHAVKDFWFLDGWIVEAAPTLTWREREPGSEPSLVFSAMREDGDMRAIRLDLGAYWPEMPHTRESKYLVRATRRWRLWRPGLFGEIRVGVDFPEKEDFAPDPNIRGMVEMILGQ